GTRFSDRVIGDKSLFAKQAAILQIDIDPAEVNKNIEVSHKVVGDIASVLDTINTRLEQMPKKDNAQWLSKVKKWKDDYPLYQKELNDEYVTPQYVIETLDELTNGEAILTTEVGQHQMWAAQFYNFRSPRSFITSGGLGTMGYGLGASLGAQVGNPDKRVVNIAGDGSFHMNCNELVTASKFNIPIIELLFNNSVLGMVRQWQRLFYGKRFSQTTLDRPTNYVMLANAFGIEAYVIERKSQVREVLEKALAASRPVLIDCHIDKDINVLPMVPAGKPIDELIMDIVIDDEEDR
ncbi:MAG TPA: thiamine pyrophosphate-dependent enzyme, partial [Oscillospiraceae bacterium]|nr:thiamine pyrophosphate-dependent enzyme [Oscillospiraceae bacterium]